MRVGMFLTRYDSSSFADCFVAVIIITVIIVNTMTVARAQFRPQYYSPEVLLMDILGYFFLLVVNFYQRARGCFCLVNKHGL